MDECGQYGGFADINKYGAFAYDPGGPHRGGPAPLAWGTQLFPNGELWLASNTVVVRERGGRPQWVPIPFIPALVLEQTFYQKAHSALLEEYWFDDPDKADSWSEELLHGAP